MASCLFLLDHSPFPARVFLIVCQLIQIHLAVDAVHEVADGLRAQVGDGVSHGGRQLIRLAVGFVFLLKVLLCVLDQLADERSSSYSSSPRTRRPRTASPRRIR